MSTPWERNRNRYNKRKRGSSQRAMPYAAAVMNEYNEPIPFSSVDSVAVNQEILQQKRQQELEQQKQKARGPLSGVAALLPQSSRDEGFGFGTDKYALPVSEGPEIDKGTMNPFKLLLQKAVAPTLEKWQEITEWTGGTVFTPFSTELKAKRDAGISASERWRSTEMPTLRIGKEQGEGFGFNVGVKGALEMLVDPVGWATMVLPVGLVFKPAAYASKRLGQAAAKATGLKSISVKGQKEFAKRAKGIDAEIANEFSNLEKSITQELLERNTLADGGFGSLADTTTIKQPKSEINLLMDYTTVMDNKQQLGFFDGISAYINQRATDVEKKKSGVFFRMLDNPIQKFRPSVAALQSKEGRALYYFNQYKTAIPTDARILRDEIADLNAEKIFKLKESSVEAVVPGQATPENLEKFFTTMSFYKAKVARETIPVNVFTESGDLAINSPMYKIVKNIEDVTGLEPDTNLIVNYSNGVANVSNRQGFQLGTFRFNALDNVIGSEDNIVSKLQKQYGVDATEAKRLRKDMNNSIISMQKKADAAGATKNLYLRDKRNLHDNLGFEGFSFSPSDTIVYTLGQEATEQRQLLGTTIENIDNILKRKASRKQQLEDTTNSIRVANNVYRDTISRYLRNFNTLDDEAKALLNPRSLRGATNVATPDNYTSLADNIIQFQTLDEALIGLRNLDDGLRRKQLRVNTRTAQTADNLSTIFGDDEFKGLTRELIRQIGKDKKTRIDFLARTDNIVGGKVVDFFKRSDAFDGQVVYKQLEQQFGKQAARIGAKKKQGDMRVAFKNIYNADIDSVFEKEMPFLQFLDMAGFVVGHSHKSGRPIRLYDTGYFQLTRNEKNFLDRFYAINDEVGMMTREEGALGALDDIVEMKTSNYVHHVVEEFGNATTEYLDTLGAVSTGARGTAALTKPSAFQQRSYRDFITEGFEEQGLQYTQKAENIIESLVKAGHTAVANKHVVNSLKIAGDKVDKAMNLALQTANAKRFTNAMTLVNNISNSLRGPITDADAATIRKQFRNDEVKTTLRRVVDDYSEFERILGTDDADFAANAGKFLGTEQLDRLAKGFKDQADSANNYIEKLNELQLKGQTTRVVEKSLGRRQRQVVKRNVKRFTGAPENVNVEPLNDLLFDESVAKKIENTLGISDPTRFEKFAEATGSVGDVFRLFQTGIDLGTPLLQGLPTLVTKPAVWAKATGKMFAGLFDGDAGEIARRQFFIQNKAELREMNSLGVLISGQGNDYYRAVDKDSTVLKFLNNQGFEKDSIPVKLGQATRKQLFGRFQNAFEDFGDRLRLGLYQAHKNQIVENLDEAAQAAYRATGVRGIQDAAVQKEFKELAEYINQMTGAFSHTQNMVSRRQANFERAFLLFSPSYTRASLGLMGSALTGGIKGDNAYRAISNMLMVGVGFHVATGFAKSAQTGEPLEKYLRLDPSKSDFLTVDINGLKVGYGSFWNSSAKLLAQIASDPAFRGDVLDSPLLLTGAGRGQAGFNEQSVRQMIGNNPVVRWLRGRAAPVGSHFWNLGMGSTPLGEELDPVSVDNLQEIGGSIAPFWIQSVFDSDNKALGLGSIPAEFIGLRTYEVPAWQKRKELRDELAYAHYDKLWRELTNVQRRNIEVLESANPNGSRLEELDGQIKEKRQQIGGSELDELLENYTDEKDIIDNIYKGEMEEAAMSYRNSGTNEAGEVIFGSPADYVNHEKFLRAQRNARYESLDLLPEFQNVQVYYESFSDFEKLERPEDYFAKKYADIYFDPEWEKANYYDFIGRDRAIQDLINSWGGDGEQLKAYALNTIFGAKIAEDNDPSGILAEYYLGQYKYFDLYYKGAHDAIMQNKYKGQLDDAYEQYRTSNATDKQNILKKNKQLARAFREISNVRQAMRERNADLDAFMYRFRVGGITTLANSQNRNREEELQQLTAMEVYTPQWRVAGT